MFKTCPRKLYFFVFVSIFFFFSNSCFSQQLVYKFKQFTSNDGLPSSEVHQVLRDSRNFMWFATDHGVCRYDGYSFQTFDLPDNSILELYEDSKKRIWAVSFSGQLFCYEGGKFSDYKYNDLVVKAIDQIAINKFYVDSLDNVYISTTAPDCFVIDKTGHLKKIFKTDLEYFINVIETDKGGFFSYITSFYVSKGVTYFTPSRDSINLLIQTKKKKYQIKYPGLIIGTKSGAIKLSDSSIVYYSGLYFFRIFSNGRYVVKKFEKNILDVKQLDQNELLVGTVQNGLYIIDKSNEVVGSYFRGLTVTSIEKDYEGGVWVSTTQEGLFYLNSLQIKHLSNDRTIIEDKVLCLEIGPDSDIWAGEESGKVFRFRENKRFKYYEFPIISVIGIHYNVARNQMIICTGDYVNDSVKIKGPAEKLLYYQHDGVNFIIVQGSTNILHTGKEFVVGKVAGIVTLDFINKKISFLNKDFFRVSSLYLDHNKNILIGNMMGLWKFKEGYLVRYDSINTILQTRITDINEYVNNLVVGTRGKGLLFLLDDSLHQITAKNGLASDNIRKIYVDSNIIWVATNRGISRLDIKSLKPFVYSIQNISAQDGLLSNEVNDIKRVDTSMIVATNEGVSLFNCNLYSEKEQLPVSLYVTGVKVNGFDTTISSHYDLYRSSRNFSISFVGLSYRKNANVEYRYRLLGIDSNWVNSTAREIQFNPIPYGKYIVQVESRRQGEEWDDYNMISVSINCEAPFWKTTWFWILSFLITAFIMMLFFVNRTKKIKAREKERTSLNKKLAEMELKALRAQMNPHFIFNILNSIQYYITHNENDAAQRYMSKFAKLVRLTLDNSRSTFILLSDELLLLKLYIDLEKIRFEDRFDYKINIADNVNINSIKIPNMLLQPYVENSIKHGFKSKQTKYFLDISVLKQNKNILCTIVDNGVGRGKAAMVPDSELDKHTSTGTIIVNEKIEALKFYYNYDLSSRTEDLRDNNGNPVGTKVTLEFPENADLSDKI